MNEKVSALSEMKETIQVSTQSLGKGVKSLPKTDNDNTMIARVMIVNCSIQGAVFILKRIFHRLMFHKIILRISVREKVPSYRFVI